MLRQTLTFYLPTQQLKHKKEEFVRKYEICQNIFPPDAFYDALNDVMDVPFSSVCFAFVFV